MQQSFLRLSAAIIASASLAACGGGGAGSTDAVPPTNPVPQASAAPAIATASVGLTFVIPARSQNNSGRHAQYISPNTTDLFVFVDGAANPSASLSTATCQLVTGANPAGQRTCLVFISVTPGIHSFKVMATETATLGSATARIILSQGTLSNFNAVSGQSTAPPLTLNAVITAVTVNSVLPLSGIQGQSTTVGFAVFDGTGPQNGTINASQTTQINQSGVLGSYDNGPLTFTANDALITVASGGPFNAPGTDPVAFSFTCNGAGTSQINWTTSPVAEVIRIGFPAAVVSGTFPVTCAPPASTVTIPIQ